jgi:hypothetical protein
VLIAAILTAAGALVAAPHPASPLASGNALNPATHV